MFICFILFLFFLRILYVLISIAYYDIRFFKIRRRQILELLLLAIGYHLAAGTFSFFKLIIGVIAATFPIIILNHLKKSFGHGDVLLMGISGILLGAKACILAEILAIFLAAMAILFNLLHKLFFGNFSLEHLKGTIPMAPFLCTAFCSIYTIQFIQTISSIL